MYGEQGIGDEIMFASLLKDISEDIKVIFDCNDRLVNIFRESFPELDIYGTKKEDPAKLGWPNNYDIAATIPIGSCSRFYRKKLMDFPGKPYLKAPATWEKVFKEKLAKYKGKKIGVSWKGGIKSTGKNYREVKLSDWGDIFNQDATFISLQYNDDSHHDIEEAGLKDKILHWQDVMDDYDQTAGLVANLDLVISVPQSAVHLAGAVGIPTWQLCPRRGMWQQGVYGHNAPWYKCVKNFWQDGFGDWDGVIKNVERELKAWIK